MSRVLVVDDELGVRDLFCEILIEEGHETRAIERGRATLDAVKEFAPELLIIDLWLRDTDGITVLEALRARQGEAMPAVIVMSGRITEEDDRRVRALGALSVLEKPVALAHLLRAVREALQSTGERTRTTGDAAAAVATADGLLHLYRLPLREAREGFERDYFLRLLQRHDHNVSQVARVSGMERTNLYRKLKQLGLLVDADAKVPVDPTV